MSDALNQIELREARIEEILDLRWAILRAGLPRESASFEGDDEPTTHHFAAVTGSEIVGCATFLQRPFNDQPGWQLRGMAVRADQQGGGIGKRLLEFAEAFILSQRYSNLLWCNARVPASRFYIRQGWTIVSEPFDIPTAGPHVKMMKKSRTRVR
jgi:predicted GNAT family N-acyltransferase